MNDNSYFSDITDLFLKAKKAENIDVNPHSKAAIREMLSYKIEQLKRVKPQQSGESFWSKWKKTLIGVPASILAVFVIVFALQNAQINMHQNDFSTEESAVSSEADILNTVEDSPVIQDIEEPEERTIKVEPLVINYEDEAKTTQLSKTTPVQTYVAPVNATTKSVEDSAPASTTSTASTPTPLPTPQPETTATTEQTGGGSTYTATEPQSTTSQSTTSQPSVQQTTTTQTSTPQTVAPAEEIPSEKVREIINDDIIIQSDDNVNYYREPISPIRPDLDKTALEKLQITDNLSTVNVHYLNEDQAAVEVTGQDGTTRWYMIEDINGNWTVTQKFD